MSNPIRITRTAFAKWLLEQPRNQAVQHLMDCLQHGEATNNVAWELMEYFHGDWTCEPNELPTFLYATLELLNTETKSDKLK